MGLEVGRRISELITRQRDETESNAVVSGDFDPRVYAQLNDR